MTRDNSADGESQQSRASFENAKEATRGAVFLSLAARLSNGERFKQELEQIFKLCRSAAITAGATMGYTKAQVDAELSELCDADTRRLKVASDKEFAEFAEEAREIVNRFLASADVN